MRKEIVRPVEIHRKEEENFQNFEKIREHENICRHRRDAEERRDVVEFSIEKLSSTSSSDTERDSLNNVSGGCVTSSKE